MVVGVGDSVSVPGDNVTRVRIGNEFVVDWTCSDDNAVIAVVDV